jgi:hypothetical protein
VITVAVDVLEVFTQDECSLPEMLGTTGLQSSDFFFSNFGILAWI